MFSHKLKQIGLALCLMASLLIGSASACTCSHHHEKTKSAEMSCHGSHEEAVVETNSSTVEAGCVCFVNQPTPGVVSKSENKKFQDDNSRLDPAPVVPDLDFAASASLQHLSPEFDRTVSYSNALRSLLPARAPPRL